MKDKSNSAGYDRCLPGFENAMAPFDRVALARHKGTVVGIDSERKIAYVNQSWDSFATENDGQPAIEENWNLGADYMAAIAPAIREFYADLFELTFSTGDRKSRTKPIQHSYQCSSPALYREFHMSLYRLADPCGILMVHSLLVERPHDLDSSPAPRATVERYRDDKSGLITQCCHCRRTQRCDDPDRWDWIPEWVERPPANASHGICDVCICHYYPGARPAT